MQLDQSIKKGEMGNNELSFFFQTFIFNHEKKAYNYRLFLLFLFLSATSLMLIYISLRSPRLLTNACCFEHEKDSLSNIHYNISKYGSV